MSQGEGVELTLDLAAELSPRLQQRLQGLGEQAIADLSYANLWLFRRPHEYRYHAGAWPVISGMTYDGQRHALPLFDIAAAPSQLLDELVRRHGALFPLCEREARALDPEQFMIEQHRDDADYVYRADAFRRYPGRLLQKKRNLMQQLLKAHRVSAEPYVPALMDEALGVALGWLRDKDKQDGDADDPACREALALAPELGLHGYLYRADGEAAGFVLAERLQDGVWVMRFAKGLVRYKGIAQYMFHHFASQEGRDVQWLNFEQDLGLPNFRRTKLSYQPERLNPKWRALLRS